MAFLQNVPKITRNLIIINIIVFVATLVNQNLIVSLFALFHPQSQHFHFWQPVTYMFVHGGFMHIFFNMYTLMIFGGVVEQILGEKKFIVLYFASGLGAAFCNMYVAPLLGSNILAPTVGASGAIYGVLLAYAMLFPESRLTLLFPPVTLSAKWMVIIFAGIEILTGVLGTSDGIAHFAHLGGMVIALILILFWRKTGRLFNKDWF